ncbi:MAG TPA: hypothetical protein VEA38_15080 [Terriglobales bacterium]|nr:hypothetical protein [Terriglobales bacterium]
MALIKTLQTLEQRVLAPNVKHAAGPVCMTCGRICDSETLVEGEPGKTTIAKVLVKHHGAEELRTFDMGSVEWDSSELASHMRRANWFDPGAHEGLGLGVKINPVDGGVADFEQTKPTIVVPGETTRVLGSQKPKLYGPDGGKLGGDGS